VLHADVIALDKSQLPPMHQELSRRTRTAVVRIIAVALVHADALLLIGCQQIPKHEVPLVTASHWDASAQATVRLDNQVQAVSAWWTLLHDPAIDALVDATLKDSPDLAQAVARMDAASAAVGESRAAGRPQILGSASTTRGSSQVSSNSSVTQVGTMNTAGISLDWESDLFGRIRAQQQAARQRLDARTVEAEGMRVALAAQVADRVVEWRACNYLQEVRQWEVASRQTTLQLTRRKVAAGMSAAIDESRSVNDADLARTEEFSQQEICGRDLNAIVALSGRDADQVRDLLREPLLQGTKACEIGGSEAAACEVSATGGTNVVLPDAPAVGLAVPATVLASNPSVMSAQREVAAATSDLDAARASRYPRLNLPSLLTGQWLTFGGQALNYATWSVGAALSGTIVDGGLANSQVDGANARYREAVAKVVSVVRASAQDIENALLAVESAGSREVATQHAVAAARTSMRIAQLQWKAGASTLLDLEDAQRQYAVASRNAVTAAKDWSQSWIALVRATGNQGIAFTSASKDNADHAQ
jgi:multidrug efflux system outer membrane protein